MLEEHAYKLVDRRGMYDHIPFVLADEQKRNKAEKHLDGTTRLGEALTVVVQFVAEWKIESREPTECKVEVGDVQLEQARETVYVGVRLSENGRMESELEGRIGRAAAVVGWVPEKNGLQE